MQVTEVRLGNLVAYKDHYQTPEVVAALNKESEKINGYDAKDFNGIPLNEQWLENFGIHRWSESIYRIEANFVDGDEGYITAYRTPDVRWLISIEKSPVRIISSVHDFQNTIHALTGQELELKKQ